MTSLYTTSPPPPPKQKRKNKNKRQEAWKDYADRRGVTIRTLNRWLDLGIIPESEVTRIRGRKYIDPEFEPRSD
jgi:hypothetical protein